MFNKFSVFQLFNRDFGVDLPIAGGIGSSPYDPVIVESQTGQDLHQVTQLSQ
jgi:hypothetical protein